MEEKKPIVSEKMFYDKNTYKKKNKYKNFSIKFIMFEIILTIASFFFFNIETFSSILVIIIFLFCAVIIIIPIGFTLGLALASDGFRSWISKVWSYSEAAMNIHENIDKISALFIYFGYAAIIFSIIGLLVSIIGQIKEKKRYIGSIIASIACLIISIVLVIMYYKNGLTL